MRMSEAPETPVTDAYAIQMRPRLPVAGVPLEPLVIAKEQRKREEWISAEAYRAATLPGELQYDIQVAAYHRQIAEYNRQMNEYHKAVAEQRALDTEAQKYGHATHESLMQAIQEEKLIKRLNELGGVLTDVQLEAQRAAREGVPQSDYLATLESQRADAERLQRSLQASFGVDVPATGYIAEVESVMAARDVAPVTMRTMAAPAPAAPYQVTIFPDLKLTTDTVPPYREPVPSDPIEQIFYHHAPIIDKFRADTRLDSPVIDIAIASASLSRAAAGRPSPIVAPIAEQLIREPTRPISALVEMPGELALGLYRIPTVAVPHYTAHPEELPGLPGKIVSGVGEEFVTDPAGFATKFVGMGYLSGPAISAARPITAPITRYGREITMSLRRTRPPAGVSPGTVYGDVGAFPDIKRVADVGRTTVYGDVGAFPDIKRVADVGRTTVYGDVGAFPDIKRVADVGRTTVYGDVGAFPDIKRVADVGVRPPDVTTVYTATELGRRQRSIMADRAAGVAPAPIRKVQVYEVMPSPTRDVSIPGSTQVLIAPAAPARRAAPVIRADVRAPVIGVGPRIGVGVSGALVRDARTPMGGVSPVSLPGSDISTVPGVLPGTDTVPSVTPITYQPTGVTPDTRVGSIQIPGVDTALITRVDVTPVVVTTPDIPVPPRPPRIIPPEIPPRPRRLPDADADKRHRYPWEEWFISYRSEPTPHKGFEGVYLGLPDVARPGPVTIKGLQRVTVGPAPARTVRPTIKRGKPLRIGKKRLF
ncbi:MAG: hypothetical protein M0P40_09470, partial [Bacteroidales bacterium]|nr:hypothetical protein [Bacteroidales bacterium]